MPQPQPAQFVLFPRSVDFGLAFGGGVALELGPQRLSLEGRLTLGLRTIDSSEPKADEKNRALSLLLGYTFR